MSSLQVQIRSSEEDLGSLIEAAQMAWKGLVAARPELTESPRPLARPPAKDRIDKVNTQPLDVCTALAWSDQVRRFFTANPRSATAAEIQNIYDAHKGRYLLTRTPPPIDQMLALRISAIQWQDVFNQACKIKDRDQRLGRDDECPPPINLFLSLAQNQVKLRASIESKHKRLTAIRQTARQEPL